MINQNDPIALAALKQVNSEIGNLVTSNATLAAQKDALARERSDLLDRIAAYETQVADMGQTNRNLLDQLDALRGNPRDYPAALGG